MKPPGSDEFALARLAGFVVGPDRPSVARRVVVDERDTDLWALGTAVGSRPDPVFTGRTEVYGPTAAAVAAEYRRLFLFAAEAI